MNADDFDEVDDGIHKIVDYVGMHVRHARQIEEFLKERIAAACAERDLFSEFVADTAEALARRIH